MRLALRWGVAVVVSAGGFALAWWVCAKLARLDEAVSLGIAGAVVAVVMAVAAWRAPRDADGDGRVVQQAGRAGTSPLPGGTRSSTTGPGTSESRCQISRIPGKRPRQAAMPILRAGI